MNSKKIIALVLALSLTPVLAFAEQNYDVMNGADFIAPTGGPASEAAKAVEDRVFGVQGGAADVKYHAIELSNHSPVNAGIRSLILPGWGQWFNREPVKASALFMVTAAAGYGSYRAYNSSRNSWDTYHEHGFRADSAYDDYTRERNQALLLGGATIVLWLYSSWDAYNNAYNPLWSKAPSVEVALNPGGADVQWRKRF
ncbi:MAG: hypothetical protein JO102_02555 [Elusimicrobia bacterium]|nr:hypothetical protein [Elusimicrobiota bacterium]